MTALTGATLMFELLCCMVERVSAQQVRETLGEKSNVR